MDNQIRHDGIIESVEENHIRVRILQTSACAECKVASHCLTAEAKEKVVDVADVKNASQWHKGQQVVVTTSKSMAGKALLLSFGLPLLLMLITMVVLTASGCQEGTVALVMLATLIPYYMIVWMMRNRIAREISFHIEEQASFL